MVWTLNEIINNISIIFSYYYKTRYKLVRFHSGWDIKIKTDLICKFEQTLFSKAITSWTFKFLFKSDNKSTHQRMIQHQSMSQCAVFGTTVNVHNTRNSMHKLWIFEIVKPYFRHIKCELIPDSSWKIGTYDCQASSHHVKSEFASQKWIQSQNSVFPTVFDACWYQ